VAASTAAEALPLMPSADIIVTDYALPRGDAVWLSNALTGTQADSGPGGQWLRRAAGATHGHCAVRGEVAEASRLGSALRRDRGGPGESRLTAIWTPGPPPARHTRRRARPRPHARRALVHRWLDTWAGLGQVVAGMTHQGWDVQLTAYAARDWRVNFFPVGIAHSIVGGTAWEGAPWRACNRPRSPRPNRSQAYCRSHRPTA
jgi:hypothetical protein